MLSELCNKLKCCHICNLIGKFTVLIFYYRSNRPSQASDSIVGHKLLLNVKLLIRIRWV